MSKLVREATKVAYKKAAKPVLFRHKPDSVHHGLVRTGRRIQNVPGIGGLPKLWSYKHPSLQSTIAGLTFENPVGLSAGFDKAIELPRLMKSVGFGWMTGGSVTLDSYDGNDGDWFYRLPHSKSLVVHAGLPSEGARVVTGRVSGYSPNLFHHFPLSVSVAKTNTKKTVGEDEAIRDYCASLALFDKLEQVSMLELNISCPNTFGGEPFTTPSRLEKLLSAIDNMQLVKPLFVKMPISLELSEFDGLLGVVVRHRVAGVATGNLLKDRTKARLKDDLPVHVKGNLSGLPTRDLSTELIRHTYKTYGEKLVIIGIGGIMSAKDAYEKIRAGASLVALITGLIYEGPQLVGDINAGLVQLLKRDGFETIHDAVGADSRSDFVV